MKSIESWENAIKIPSNQIEKAHLLQNMRKIREDIFDALSPNKTRELVKISKAAEELVDGAYKFAELIKRTSEELENDAV